ncbi:MAG: DNA-dependent helicase [Candidatus Hydrogenedentota bacterium]
MRVAIAFLWRPPGNIAGGKALRSTTLRVNLNEQQRAAVTAPDGPSLVLAGAGSGKTRVIIERLAYLIDERGEDPRGMLALTFTNKAAGEMRERLCARLGVERLDAWMGTFHSFGLYLLRREIERLGRARHFTIFDDGDQLSLMKRLVRDMPSKFAKVSPRSALHYISRLKQDVGAPPPLEEELEPEEATLRHLWHAYHDTLHKANAVDFDDLLVLTVRLLEDFPDAREKYQRRYRHLLIDEYQDTNRAQYLIARRLSEAHGNLFVVGDEDQSIYSWRGADINNILDFAQDFPDANVFRLEVNYRSSKEILDAANRLVANNAKRLGKTLTPANPEGPPVHFEQLDDGLHEARFVVEDMAKRGLEPRGVAIMYRTNQQSRVIEEALMAKGIQPRVLGGIQFYRRKEVKDVIAYLRLLVNANDDEALLRIVNVPARGMGAQTLERIEEYARARGHALLRVMRDIEHDDSVPARARDASGKFVQLIDDLAILAKTEPLHKLVREVVDRTGYRQAVEQSDEKDFRDRIDNIEEFISACKQYEQRNENATLEAYLQEMALLSDSDDYDPALPAATLLTCHTAKGLEFDHVYLVGCEEGLLPHGLEFEGDRDVEEERRLCYVAMTRARKSLVMTAARARMLYGRTDEHREVSRFVREAGVLAARKAAVPPEEKSTLRAGRPAQPLPQAAPVDSLPTGTVVRHARFGDGVVLFSSGSGASLKAKVRFNSGRTVMLMMSVAPVEVVKKPRG